MAEFKYASDAGVRSVPQLEAFARQSKTDFRVVSTTGGGHVNNSWHYKGNAIDMSSSAGSMVKLAAYLYQFSDYWLELEHSGGPGYFVKNGKRVSGSYYGAATVSQHYDHVHFAATLSGLAAASGKAGTQSGVIDPTTAARANQVKAVKTNLSGCATVGTSAILVFSGSVYGVVEFLRSVL